VHLALQRAPARIEVASIEGESARQSEQLEIVSGKVHTKEKGPRSGPA
jgi:hypothetical protein